MKPFSFMLIAGEASGDANAAELVKALAEMAPLASDTDETQPLYASLRPEFFGAGGPKMAQAGVELAFDMTTQSVVGFSDVAKKLFVFRRLFKQLLDLAAERQPDVIVLVDFGGFNRRFARAVKKRVDSRSGIFDNWQPRIVQYVSPQVWASRPGRAEKLARDIDLLLCLFPFEKEWYAQRLPQLHVEYVGNPIFDRYAHFPFPSILDQTVDNTATSEPVILLLPGSRKGELRQHMPILLDAAKEINVKQKVRFQVVVSDERLAGQARKFDLAAVPNLELKIGGLAESLSQARVAISKTGTIALECAYFGVPTITFYKVSQITYQIALRLIQVRFLSMPNLLADEAVYPEFVRNDATPENIARETIDLLTNTERRRHIRAKLKTIIATLGGSGAAQRAAQAIVQLTQKQEWMPGRW